MKPDETRFLARVCADPDNDSPRLIYADWLDEHDDPRGEFIRIQVALARVAGDDPSRSELLDREAALLARYHASWSDPLRGVAGWAEFRRGFVDTVNVEARAFLRRAEDLLRLAPIRHIRFLDVGSSLSRLVNSPHLNRLAGLTIYAQHIGEDLTRASVESPHLADLRSLNVGRNRIGDRGAERLAWSSRFRQLTRLDLSDNAIGDTGARAIAGSSNLANLESLELRRNELNRAGLGWLCASSALRSLSHLGLSLNHVGVPQDRSPPPAGRVSLGSLDLSENGLTAEAMPMLTMLPGLAELSRLVLQHNEIGNGGATTLAEWSGAVSLESLVLADNRIGDDGARVLARSPYFFRLLDLDLSDNPIHDPGAFEFLNSRSLPRLRNLRLPHLGLTPQMRRTLSTRYSR